MRAPRSSPPTGARTYPQYLDRFEVKDFASGDGDRDYYATLFKIQDVGVILGYLECLSRSVVKATGPVPARSGGHCCRASKGKGDLTSSVGRVRGNGDVDNCPAAREESR